MTRVQWLAFAEPAIVFSLIMLYIWRLRYTEPHAWIFILGLVILSHVVHHERSAALGFRWGNFRECVEKLAPALLLLAMSMLACGVLLQTFHNVTFNRGLLCLLAYCPWGLFQQYLLNGYFANRLLAAAPARHVPLIAAALFSGIHLPNWFLMMVTFAAGYCSTRIFMKYRNVYFLGLAHGVIGTLLFVVIPNSISHHLAVGPGFFVP
jgi:Type II CAAX prenyl endopeptidase Rce1-like